MFNSIQTLCCILKEICNSRVFLIELFFVAFLRGHLKSIWQMLNQPSAACSVDIYMCCTTERLETLLVVTKQLVGDV